MKEKGKLEKETMIGEAPVYSIRRASLSGEI